MPRTPIDLSLWQDFRGKDEGLLLHISTSREALMPVRDALDEFGKGHQTEPNYETGTFGLVGPSQVRLRNTLVRNKRRWIFFATFYDGLATEHKGRFLVIGYMRIDKIRDVRPLHMRKWLRGSAPAGGLLDQYFELDKCWALWSDEMRFFAPGDALAVDLELARRLGAKSRPTRQCRLTLGAPAVRELLAHFEGRTDQTEEYIATVCEFQEFLRGSDDETEPSSLTSIGETATS